MTALMGLATRLKLARLMVVTDARAATRDLVEFVSAALASGADILHLADERRRPRDLKADFAAVSQAARRGPAIVSFGADADVAGDVLADALVLAHDGISAAEARRRVHEFALVGRSCVSLGDVDAALADPGIDFLLVTAELPTVAHLARVAPASDPASKVWFAAGGVTPERLPALLQQGCRRVAVGRALARATDPAQVTRTLADALGEAWDADASMALVRASAFDAQRPAGGPRETGGALNNPFAGATEPPLPADSLKLPDPDAS